MRASAFVAATVACAALLLVGIEPAGAAGATTPAGTHATTPGSTATTTRPVPAGMQRVELSLAPRDATGLAALARTARSLTPSVREARRQAALPGAARAAEVAGRAEKLGLTVISTSDTGVTVAGPPSLVRTLFGSARDSRPTIPTAQALPKLPPSLAGLVLVAGGGDETRPAYQPRGTLTQAQFQSIYSVPSTSAPPTASSPTVATLQFSNWDPSDLSTYVAAHNIYGASGYDPVTDGGYSSVVVDGGPSDSDGSLEVALDQEALVTMAPGVRQRAYLINNNSLSSAEADAFNQVARDAKSKHIVALSTSWGNCEPYAYWGPNDPQLKADRAALDNVIAAGVTVFAASGDAGSNDCFGQNHNGTGSPTVDVPAAFPEVVAVGGTTVHTGSSGTSQTVWNNSIGASGGGYSSLFARPSWQNGVVSNAMRGVPDIAMDGDPQTGLDAYATGPAGCDTSDNTCAIGGTSLSAPLAAGSLAAILAIRGATSGLGDIHALLYAATPCGAYTDVTSGNNGAYSAGPGWDPTTGLGAPLWSTLLPVPTATPIRLIDTRCGLGGLEASTGAVAPAGPLLPNRPYTLDLSRTAASLPNATTGIVVNIAAIGATGVGNLRIAPSDNGQVPGTAAITYQPGEDVSNGLVLPYASTYTVYSDGARANVTIDLESYETQGFAGTDPPTRVADTRPSQGGAGTLSAGTSRSFPIAGTNGDEVPPGAKAVAISVTAVQPSTLGNLRIYPDGVGVPNTANITYIPGQDKSAFAIVPLPSDGHIDVYTDGAAVDVVVDVFGYFTASSSLSFLSSSGAPARVLDTRPGTIAANAPYVFSVAGRNGIPTDAQSVVVSITGVHAAGSTGVGNLRIYPSGTALPNTAVLNYVGPAADVANFAIVPLGITGDITLYSDGSAISPVLDVFGYIPAGG